MEYTDESFREEKQQSAEEKHLGILGENYPGAQILSVSVRRMLMLGVPGGCTCWLILGAGRGTRSASQQSRLRAKGTGQAAG